MNEAIERMNKKVIISLNEYLELENIKKCHKENMKISYGKVLLTSDDYERYKAIEHNWNELKNLLEEETRQYWNTEILDKMQELEEGGNND